MKKHIRLMGLLSLCLLLMAFIGAGLTHAGLLCRSDPIVVLSNGVVLQMTADITADPTQVTEVYYELHVPVGVSMNQVTYTALGLPYKETLRLFADQPAGQYQVITVAYTTLRTAAVSASTLVSAPLMTVPKFYSVSGKERTRLSVSIKLDLYGGTTTSQLFSTATRGQ